MFHSHYCQESMFWLVMIRSGYCIIFLGRLSLPTSHALDRNSSNDPAKSAARGARGTRDCGFICQYVRPTSGAGIEVFNVLFKKRLITFPPLSPFMFLTCMKECSSLSPILSTEPTGTIPANLHHSELREPVGRVAVIVCCHSPVFEPHPIQT